MATANGGGFTVSTRLQSLFNIRVPATSNQNNNIEIINSVFYQFQHLILCSVIQMVFVSGMLQPLPNLIQAPVYLSQSSTLGPDPTMAGPVVQSDN